MAPKPVKGKGVAKGAGTVEPPESALSGDRTKSAFFFPSTVDVQELRASFKPLWGVKTGERIRDIRQCASFLPLARILPLVPILPQIGIPFSSIIFLAGYAPLFLISSVTLCTPSAFASWILL